MVEPAKIAQAAASMGEAIFMTYLNGVAQSFLGGAL